MADDNETPVDTTKETTPEDVNRVAGDLDGLMGEKPNIEVGNGEEEPEPKKKRKTRKKKIVEPVFDLEDASTLVSLPFTAWGKPLTPEENARLTSVVSRWLDKRAGDLAKYSVDIALAVCLLEVLLKRTNILGNLIPKQVAPEGTDAK